MKLSLLCLNNQNFFLQTEESWKIVFVIASCIHFSGVLFYGFYASGERQPWADPPEEEIGILNANTPDSPDQYKTTRMFLRLSSDDSLSSPAPPDLYVKKIIQNGGYNPMYEGPASEKGNGFAFNLKQRSISNSPETSSSNLSLVSKLASEGPSYDVVTETVQIESKDTWLGRLSDDGE